MVESENNPEASTNTTDAPAAEVLSSGVSPPRVPPTNLTA